VVKRELAFRRQREAVKPRLVGVASRWPWKSPLFSLTTIGLMVPVSAGIGGPLSPMNCVEQRLGNTRVERAGTLVPVRFSDA
jgi:hypothetical protein